jgi:hypothetical protein
VADTLIATPDPERHCSYCGEPIPGRAMALPPANPSPDTATTEYFHTATGIYGPKSGPSCAMVVAELELLRARGWALTPVNGCVTWANAALSVDAGRRMEAHTWTASSEAIHPGPA